MYGILLAIQAFGAHQRSLINAGAQKKKRFQHRLMIITMSCLTSLRALGRPICSRTRGCRMVWHWTRLSPTACKSSLLFLVAESIRQLKWVWFSQQGKDQRRDYYRIYCRSMQRGPLGSLTIRDAITLLLPEFDFSIQQMQQISDYSPGEGDSKSSDKAVAK